MGDRVHTTLDLRHITLDDILRTTTVEAAMVVHEQTFCNVPTNGREPWLGPVYPVGTWRCDPIMNEWDVLIEVHAHEVMPMEGDWDFILRHWTTQNYIKWLLEGHQPPPIDVVRNLYHGIVSCNRRRVLAARAADLPIMLAWFSETDENGRALWKGE